jgi:hypothetical protein
MRNLRHHSLIAWQSADDLFIKVHQLATTSLAELGYCLHEAHRLGNITAENLSYLARDLNGVGAPLTGLVRSTRLMAVVEPTALLVGMALLAYWVR